MSLTLNTLTALSAVDGRYRNRLEVLASLVSEQALMAYRVRVETEFLRALAETPHTGVRRLRPKEVILLRSLGALTENDAATIKALETKGYGDIPATNHDVKAVEYYIRLRLKDTSLKDVIEWVHFGLTSEDINNISYALMLRDACTVALMPQVERVVQTLKGLARTHAAHPMLARTHGQSASPTTFGKEMRVFAARLERELGKLKSFSILAKLNGATGNYNALAAALPRVDWVKFSRQFLERFNTKQRGIMLAHNNLTTQIEPHDSYVELFQLITRINTILIDFDQDMWRYISDGWLRQRVKPGEVGSSAMPHKVNPIDFENSEGNLGLSNALLNFFAQKLPVSRLQRDLSDSTVERSFGTALAHAYLGYDSALRGLSKIVPDPVRMKQALMEHPEVLAEAIQSILRREGVPAAYEKLKTLTRGQHVTLESIRAFIKTLPVSSKVKKELSALTPTSYTGLASKLAK